MKERAGDRLLPIGLSILIHAAIVGALIWGAVWYRRPRPAPSTLAIEATVVSSAPAAAPPAAAPSPAPPSPPAPDAEAAQRAEQEEAQRKHQQELEQQQAQERAQQQEKERAAAAEAAAQAEREAAEQAAAEQAAAAKIAAEKAAAQQAREEAERRAKAQEAAKAAAAAKAAQERAQSEADLRAQMAAEEHLNAEQANGAMAQYQALIAARIERVWIKPPTAHAGIRCAVQITQVPGGEITGVHVGACNGDDAVRQSIEAAAYRASPLPPPSDPALFDRDVVVTFTPHD
jgi:colicin import membrane protein